MKVSIIIPISKEDNNQKEKIRNMLMQQSEKPDEVLFISDGTIPEARNIGTKMARNNHILHCDAGTIYPNNYVEEMCKGFKKSDFITARFHMYGDKYQNFLVRNNFGSSRCIGFTKDLWTEVGGYNEGLNWGEDTDFNYKITDSGTPLYITDAICFWKGRPNRKALAKQFRNYGWGDKKSNRVKKIAYFFPVLLFAEWGFYSLGLLRTIWTYRMNYWRGII